MLPTSSCSIVAWALLNQRSLSFLSLPLDCNLPEGRSTQWPCFPSTQDECKCQINIKNLLNSTDFQAKTKHMALNDRGPDREDHDWKGCSSRDGKGCLSFPLHIMEQLPAQAWWDGAAGWAKTLSQSLHSRTMLWDKGTTALPKELQAILIPAGQPLKAKMKALQFLDGAIHRLSFQYFFPYINSTLYMCYVAAPYIYLSFPYWQTFK